MADCPVDALLAVTYRCNARCAMCNIWRVTEHEELDPEEWSNLPGGLRDVNISGGEPFLRDDLPRILSVIRRQCPRARIIVSSNGLGPERIGRLAREMARIDPAMGVGISIDGIGEAHDRIRGVKGAYAQAVESLEALRLAGVKDLRIAFTALEQNLDQVALVYSLSRAMRVEFSFVVAHGSDVYFRTGGDFVTSTARLRSELNSLALSELKSAEPKRWARSYFYRGLGTYIRDGKRILPCLAARASVFIDPAGEVRACNVLDLGLGNIRETPFAEIWHSARMGEVRNKVLACRTPCWMMCSARASIKKNPLRAGIWMASSKLMVHLGRRDLV